MRMASLALGLAAAMVCTTSVAAQILGGVAPGLPGNIGGGLPDIPRVERRLTPIRPAPLPPLARTTASALNAVDDLATAPLADLRRLTAERLLRDHADVVEPDDQGRPVVRGEILAVGVDATTVRRLREAGFKVRAQGLLAGLGIDSLTLGAPKGLSAAEALRRLHDLDPAGQYDFNHLYQESGAVAGLAIAAKASAAMPDGRGLRIGLVDGAVATRTPALARSRLVQQAFAVGGPRALGSSGPRTPTTCCA